MTSWAKGLRCHLVDMFIGFDLVTRLFPLVFSRLLAYDFALENDDLGRSVDRSFLHVLISIEAKDYEFLALRI